MKCIFHAEQTATYVAISTLDICAVNDGKWNVITICIEYII